MEPRTFPQPRRIPIRGERVNWWASVAAVFSLGFCCLVSAALAVVAAMALLGDPILADKVRALHDSTPSGALARSVETTPGEVQGARGGGRPALRAGRPSPPARRD